MPYQIQIKAVERRFNRGKFIFAAIKNIVAVATTVLPPILSALDTNPKNKTLTIVTSSIGYTAYISKQLFEFIENNELRENVKQYRNGLNQLITHYNSRHNDPNDQVTIAPTWSQNTNGFTLFHPNGRTANMFGAKANEPWALIFTLLQFALITTAFIVSVIQESVNSDAKITFWDVILPLILGGLGAIIDPITEHLTKGNLIRARDIHQDAIYAFYRPVTVSPTPAIINIPHTNKVKRRLAEAPKGLAETFFIAKTSGRNNTTVDIATNDRIPQLKVHPNRYRYYNPPPQAPLPNTIVEIIKTGPVNESDITRNAVMINDPDTPLIYRP